jgi:hypothetical protein
LHKDTIITYCTQSTTHTTDAASRAYRLPVASRQGAVQS